MPSNLASCILKDFLYQQDKKAEYVFQDDKFILVNRDEVADSILKPFKVTIKTAISESVNTYLYLEHHNEFITYILVMMILDCVNMIINVHEDLPLFGQFLYDVHYRKLSRSALELFLNHHIYRKEA